MSDVTILSTERLKRRQPSRLRWIAGGAYWTAHYRSAVDGRPTCGAPGDLILAAAEVPTCPDCEAVR